MTGPAADGAATDGRPPALLEARQLTAGYGGMAVVRDVDLGIGAGEVLALLGPNGAGKSTLLRALLGQLRPLAGEVRWRGRTAADPVPRRVRAGLGYVPEGRSVFMELTVLENLKVGRGDPDRGLELFPELRHHLPRTAGLLSGGQQQMLCLARALAGAPVVLLLDELSLGLAPLVVRRLLDAVRRAADAGTGVVLVEQHARQALRIADQVVVLQRGRVALRGSSADVSGRLADLEASYLDRASGAGALP